MGAPLVVEGDGCRRPQLAVCWPSAQVGMPPELRGRVAGKDGSMANFGEDERFRSQMFEGNNNLRFERPVDEASRRWWLDKFYDAFGLTPEDMADRISGGAPGDKPAVAQSIGGIAGKVTA